jgi:hypothetical protein
MRLDQAAKEDRAVLIAGDPASGHMTYVARSRVFVAREYAELKPVVARSPPGAACRRTGRGRGDAGRPRDAALAEEDCPA